MINYSLSLVGFGVQLLSTILCSVFGVILVIGIAIYFLFFFNKGSSKKELTYEALRITTAMIKLRFMNNGTNV